MNRPQNNNLKVRVKTAKKRKISSTLWLQRQLNDPYVAAAKKEGYRSRAAYKLIEIDEKFKLLKRNALVLDLGAAPGGWSQVAYQKITQNGGRGRILAIDIQDMMAITGVEFMQMDFSDEGAEEKIIEVLGSKVDLVLSDMAPFTIGSKSADHLRIMALVEQAAYFSAKILKSNGAFVCKVFQGGAESHIMHFMKQHFKNTKHFKPPSSRTNSSEMFLVATGFKDNYVEDEL